MLLSIKTVLLTEAKLYVLQQSEEYVFCILLLFLIQPQKNIYNDEWQNKKGSNTFGGWQKLN